jgi:hypothetical protein
MPKNLVTYTHRHSVATEFRDSFVSDENSYYLFIGNVLPWANNGDNDYANIATPINSEAYIKTVFDGMISAKRIRGDSVKLVVPRRDWEANVVYTAFDDQSTNLHTDFANVKSYVVTSNRNVWLCIDNNGANTTLVGNEPVNISNNNGFNRTLDGYLWKYLYTIGENDPFFTNEWMPVPDETPAEVPVENQKAGTVDRIIVENSGIGYNNGEFGVDAAGFITIEGDGTGAEAVANTDLLGEVLTVKMLSHGEGYTYANVIFSGGTGAIARAVLSPPSGHGKHPAKELDAKDVMVSLKMGEIDSTEGGTVTKTNDYRQFGVIKNPYKYGMEDVYETANSVSCCMNITAVVDNNDMFVNDEYVFQYDSSGNELIFDGYIVDANATSQLIRVTQYRGTPGLETQIFNETSSRSKRVLQFENPAFERYHGDIVYVENVLPIQRNENQAESFNIVFRF